jgi:hypothetical protein
MFLFTFLLLLFFEEMFVVICASDCIDPKSLFLFVSLRGIGIRILFSKCTILRPFPFDLNQLPPESGEGGHSQELTPPDMTSFPLQTLSPAQQAEFHEVEILLKKRLLNMRNLGSKISYSLFSIMYEIQVSSEALLGLRLTHQRRKWRKQGGLYI